jgi:hypothetical protein
MKSLRTLAGLSGLAVLLPLQSLAAFVSPGSLFASMRNDGAGRDFTAELHGQVETYYVSAWMKGSYEGTWPKDGRGKESMTIDFASPKDGITTRAKVELLFVKDAAYLRVNGIEGTLDQEMSAISAKFSAKQWIKIPLDYAMLAEEAGMSEEAQQALLTNIVDAVFTMDAKPVSFGTQYELHLKRDFLRQAVAALDGMDGGLLSLSSDDELQKSEHMILQHTTFSAKLFFDTKNLSLGSTVNIEFSMPEEQARLTLKIDSSRRKGALSIDVPQGAVDLDTFLDSFGSELSTFGDLSPSFSLDSFGSLIPSQDADLLDSSDDWLRDGLEDSASSSSVSSCNPSQVRKGLCGATRPSRR